MELIAGIAALLGFGVALWWLLNRPDDPNLDEETAGFVAANWRPIGDHLHGDEQNLEFVREYEAWAEEDAAGRAFRKGALEAAASRWRDE